MIYFLQREDGAIKIGTTINLKSRLAALTKEHGALRLLGLQVGSYIEEQQLHLRFQHLRLTGEFFDDHEELVTFIEKEANLTLAEIIAIDEQTSIQNLEEAIKDVAADTALLSHELEKTQKLLIEVMAIYKDRLTAELNLAELNRERIESEMYKLAAERDAAWGRIKEAYTLTETAEIEIRRFCRITPQLAKRIDEWKNSTEVQNVLQ